MKNTDYTDNAKGLVRHAAAEERKRRFALSKLGEANKVQAIANRRNKLLAQALRELLKWWSIA